jgi:SET domain-containing protein
MSSSIGVANQDFFRSLFVCYNLNMIHAKYKLKASNLHGIGLFIDEDVKQGELIYTASPLLDLNITQEQFDLLDQKEKDEILWWGFFDHPSQMWHVDFDVSKFINHSYRANLTQHDNRDEAYLIAARDISIGEELTQNYLEFETQEDLAHRGIPAQS